MAQNESQLEETRHIRELRKQNEKLKRENAQLKKKISQLENINEMAGLEEEAPAPKPKGRVKHSCLKCGSYNISEFLVMDKPYYKCEDCGGKGKL